jgi:hypothetical protein
VPYLLTAAIKELALDGADITALRFCKRCCRRQPGCQHQLRADGDQHEPHEPDHDGLPARTDPPLHHTRERQHQPDEAALAKLDKESMQAA